MNLCNQVVLVAGGIGTIGRGISRGLLRAGANVVVYSRSDAKLDQLVSELSTSDTTHGRLIGMNGTMSTPEGARALHQDLTNMTGGAHTTWLPTRGFARGRHAMQLSVTVSDRHTGRRRSSSSRTRSFSMNRMRWLK